MIDRRLFVSELIACGLSVAILPIASSSKSFAGTLAALDKDNDGTLDLAEVKDAAASVFDKLEKDSDATLDSKEIGGRAGKKEFKDADPDHDGTLTLSKSSSPPPMPARMEPLRRRTSSQRRGARSCA
jgi:hypothetical protein